MRLKIPTAIRNLLKTTSFWKDNYFVLREFKYFRRIAILALVFTLLGATFEGFGVGFILTFLQSLTSPNAAPIQTGVSWFDIGILGVNASVTERLYRISGLILFTTLLRLSFTYWGRLYSHMCQYALAYQLRLRIFEQLQALSLSYFAKTRAGNLVNSITSEVNQVTLAFNVICLLITRGSTLIVYVVSILLLSWQLTILTLILMPVFLIVQVRVGRRRQRIARRTQESLSEMTAITEESLSVSGILLAKVFGRGHAETERQDVALGQSRGGGRPGGGSAGRHRLDVDQCPPSIASPPSPAWKRPRAPLPTKLKAWVTIG